MSGVLAGGGASLSTPDGWRWTDERGVQRLVSTAELSSALASGVIPASTLVWRQGMEAWVPASTLAEFASAAQVGRSSAASLKSPGEPTAASSGEGIVDEPSDTDIELELDPDPSSARSSRSERLKLAVAANAAGNEVRKEARPQPSSGASASPSAGPPGMRKRESMRTLKGIDAPGAQPPSAPSAPIIVPTAGGTFDAGVARAITQLPRYGTPQAGNDAGVLIPRAPRLPSTDGRNLVGSAAPRAATKAAATAARPVGRSAPPPRPMPTSKASQEPGGASATPSHPDKVAAATPSAAKRPMPASGSAAPSAPPPRPSGRSVAPPPVPVRLPAIPARKFPSKAPPAAPALSASTKSPVLGRALPPPPPLHPPEAAQPSVTRISATGTPATGTATGTPATAATATTTAATAQPATATAAPATAAPAQPAALGSPAQPSPTQETTARVAFPAAAAPVVTADETSRSVTKEPSTAGAQGETAKPLPAALSVETTATRELPDEHRPGPSPSIGGAALSDRSPASTRPSEEIDTRAQAKTPSLEETPSEPPSRLPAHRPRLSPAGWLRSHTNTGEGLFAASVQVSVSSLVGSGGALIFMVVAAFFVGRRSMDGARSASIETARSALGAAPSVTRLAAPALPKPCWVARQPRRWAPLVAKSIPFDVATTSAGTFLVGYAHSSTEAAEIEFNPTTGSLDELLSRKESADIVSIMAGEGDRFGVITTEQRAIRSLVSVPGSTPFMVGVANGSVVSTTRADGDATPLWPLQGDEQIESPRALMAGSAGYAVAFRRDKAVWMGWLGPDRKPKGELTTVSGSGGAVGKPSISWNGQQIAVVFADRPSAGGSWEIRAGHAAAGVVPTSTQVIPLPSGGPGGDAFAPDIAGLEDGRWLLVWTEGPPGSRAMRAQTLASDLTPLGDPIALSPPAGNFGQGLLGVSQKAGYVGVVFLSKPAASYELWGLILQCG